MNKSDNPIPRFRTQRRLERWRPSRKSHSVPRKRNTQGEDKARDKVDKLNRFARHFEHGRTGHEQRVRIGEQL